MSAARTPGPWAVHDSCGDLLIQAAARSAPDQLRVASIGTVYSPAETAANAAFIVQACNAHDELVAALETARLALMRYGAFVPENERASYAYACDKANAALAKAQP